ncbi:LOW QUALITY PROTEIN: 1,5-anhydro-D-fructose reductase-like [Penaeus japonicus]|uniref:LOW QUALITY PROTEIN: 1,5-anhydro-D-fructose reductase-like n=1 Tax=Penaeus japonicus TaxID=27405 RepID=UPI001C714D2C|nr:LOW QUALITY PROTEIN: 1,5-anhydro-D-fructose reductase-like [Penaeus japonicus]
MRLQFNSHSVPVVASGSTMSQVPKVKFFNGKEMPVLGLGTCLAKGDEVRQAVQLALECGYRHFDTAALYENEEAIGDVLGKWISEGKVAREELFITTKLPMIANRAEDVTKFLMMSLKKLQLSYVDLYLIHFPVGMKGKDENDILPKDAEGKIILDMDTDLISLWKAMEEQVDAGRAKSVGISNFNSEQIDRIMKSCRIQPANHQVEIHAFHQQKELRAFCHKHNITVCAFSPLGAPYKEEAKDKPVLQHPVDLHGCRWGKTPAQIILRHLIQLGIVVIPKSTNPERIKENFQVFNFSLSDKDMRDLDSLDQGRDGKIFIFKDSLLGVSNHQNTHMIFHFRI